jgi:hypothetical protein
MDAAESIAAANFSWAPACRLSIDTVLSAAHRISPSALFCVNCINFATHWLLTVATCHQARLESAVVIAVESKLTE